VSDCCADKSDKCSVGGGGDGGMDRVLSKELSSAGVS
jgi:hypothetical protein